MLEKHSVSVLYMFMFVSCYGFFVTDTVGKCERKADYRTSEVLFDRNQRWTKYHQIMLLLVAHNYLTGYLKTTLSTSTLNRIQTTFGY